LITKDSQQTGFASVNGTQIFYTIDGSERDETILMIHAGICDHRMWQPQVSHFAKRYRVVTLDMRGFGQSKMVEGEFSFYEDILALLDTLKIEQAWLMGCSLGGKAAINLTLTKPERVQGLILVCPAFGGYQYEGENHPLEAAIDTAYNNGDMELVSELEVQFWVDGEGRKADEVDAAVRKLVWEMNLIPLKVDEALWEQEVNLEPPASERLQEIDKPTLIIIGDLDIASSKERADILEKGIADAKKITMNRTAHVPNMEFPEQFNQIVDEYLRGI
jgi:pimeloyl-ACP methyl ester carboxylesterase